MDSAASRFVAAVLSQNPGSGVTEQAPGAVVVSLPVGGVRAELVVLEVKGPPAVYAEPLQRLVAGARLGVPLHVVFVHDASVDVAPLIQEHIKPTGMQMKQVDGWSWVPGQPIVSVRGPALGQLKSAAELANGNAHLSLADVHQAARTEAELVEQFRQAVMVRKPVVSWAIAGVCAVFFALQLWWGDGDPIVAAARMGAEIPSLVRAGEWWRLFSVMLLHGSGAHLVMNMLALLSFGPFLERLLGNARYLLLYVLSGLGGSLASFTRADDVIGVGASGGIWGLMVAGAVVVTWPRGVMPASLAHQLRQRAWTPVGINLLYSLQPGIDMLAHLGGGLAGGLLVFVMSRRGGTPDQPFPRSRVYEVAAAAAALVLASSMGIALQRGQPWAVNAAWTLERTKVGDTGYSVLVPAGWKLERDDFRYTWVSPDDPATAMLVVVAKPFDGEVPDAAQAIDELIAEFSNAPPEGFHFTQKPRRQLLPSGREAMFYELVGDDARNDRFSWRWVTLEPGPRYASVLVTVRKKTSEERRKQLAEIGDSLKPEN